MELFYCTLLIALMFTQSAQTSKVLFYESEEFIGLLTEQIAVDTCTNLPRRHFARSNSLTTDSCLIVYMGENCTQTSIRIEPGSYSSLANNVSHAYNQHFGSAIKAYHKCPKSSDVPRVTFFQENEILGEYTDVCRCVTLPSAIDRATKMDNHGSCVNLYMDAFGLPPSCSGAFETIQGGNSFLTQNLRNLTHSPNSWVRLVAIGPCPGNLSKCTRLSAVVTKFIVGSDTDVASSVSTLSSLSMAMTTSIRNNGSAKVSEEYRASKTVTESTETELITSYSRMDNWTVETGFSVEFTQEVPMVATATISSSLHSAYNSQENISVEQSNITRKQVNTNFSVSQKIEIEPCSIYNVNSFVKMVNNFPVSYKVYVKISGVSGSKKLTAHELRQQLGELEWDSDIDEHSVMAFGVGKMLVDFGVETVINGEGQPIRNCAGVNPNVNSTQTAENVSSVNQSHRGTQSKATLVSQSVVLTLVCLILGSIFS